MTRKHEKISDQSEAGGSGADSDAGDSELL